MIRVVTKNAQGNSVPNVPFILRREGSKNRQNAEMINKSITVINAAGASARMNSSSSLLYGVTGADGTTSFTVKQDDSMGTGNQYVRPVVSADDRIQQITGHVYRHNQPGYATGKVTGGICLKRLLPGRELPLSGHCLLPSIQRDSQPWLIMNHGFL